MVEWKSLKYQFDKQIAVQKMGERQQKELEREMQKLGEEIAKATDEIVDLKEELNQGRKKVEMQLEYDKMAKDILKVPSRAKSQKYALMFFYLPRLIDSIEREIQQSQIELDLMDEILETRKSQFQSFVASIHTMQSVLENSKADESVELAKRLAAADIADDQNMEEEEEEVAEMHEQD